MIVLERRTALKTIPLPSQWVLEHCSYRISTDETRSAHSYRCASFKQNFWRLSMLGSHVLLNRSALPVLTLTATVRLIARIISVLVTRSTDNTWWGAQMKRQKSKDLTVYFSSAVTVSGRNRQTQSPPTKNGPCRLTWMVMSCWRRLDETMRISLSPL